MKFVISLFYISFIASYASANETIWLPEKHDSITVISARIMALRTTNSLPPHTYESFFSMLQDLKRVQEALMETKFPQKNVSTMTLQQAEEYFQQAMLFLKRQKNN
jgi:hypothetical protein